MLYVLVGNIGDAGNGLAPYGNRATLRLAMAELVPSCLKTVGLALVFRIEMYYLEGEPYDVEYLLLTLAEIFLLTLLFPQTGNVSRLHIPYIAGIEVQDGFQIQHSSLLGTSLTVSHYKIL